MNTPEGLKYNKNDEWVKVEGEIAVIGISDYAQDQLSDVVFVEIHVSVGDVLAAGKVIATVESVKATSDVTTPVSGKVVEVNPLLGTSPEIINTDPYGQAWLVKLQLSQPDEVEQLMTALAYQAYRKI